MADEVKTCPVPSVHACLNDAHILWHQALEAYHDPHRFRAFLNACVQALRNVTFVLQKNKTAIPDFESWYPVWQEQLKTDPVLRWLVEARNRVVKQGDLETRSLARLSIVDSYLAAPELVLDVDPFASLADIGRLVAKAELSQHTRENGSARLERRWESSDLADHELLDALAHCYGVLSSLVADAHVQAGFTRESAETCTGGLKGLEDGSAHLTAQRLGGRPPCMVATEAPRSIWVRLDSGEEFFLGSFETDMAGIDEEKVMQRYGPFAKHEPVDAKDLRQLAEILYRMAERILKRDGFHEPIAFLISPDSSLVQIALVS